MTTKETDNQLFKSLLRIKGLLMKTTKRKNNDIVDETENGIDFSIFENDITEETDLSDRYPEIIRQIEEIMISEHKKPEVERFNIFTRNN